MWRRPQRHSSNNSSSNSGWKRASRFLRIAVMADPRFYDNRGPFTLAQICAGAGAALPPGADGTRQVDDVASLDGAGPPHLTFFSGDGSGAAFAASAAGFCFVPALSARPRVPPSGMTAIGCTSVLHAFAAAAGMFYPDASLPLWTQKTPIDPTARIGEGAVLAPGVVLGPGVEIGENTRIGPNSVIARGVAIGRRCEIAANVAISHAYIGDEVSIYSGAQIGQPGFGFASDTTGHLKIPQTGRVIVQDRVEIGAGTTIDRGVLGDTVIGEGTKIDNLVQIGHNTHIGRHCIIVAQVGISGSCELGDFVVLGGQAGVADHAHIGARARLAARAAAAPGDLPGGQDYGGAPAKPIRQWARELAAVTLLAKRRKT
jgi:UDP-3-O-[3-hydroxymyristoyl] glucosamine N-acyltransferase